MSTPLVSIIMPLYNKRPYVRRAVESVLNQTFSNWELIIVDDGSTDGSSEEVPSDDPRIKLHYQENAGPGAARNKGIKQAQGEYVTFIDADDYYYPNKLEQEMKLLHEEKLAEWMMSTFDYEYEGHVQYKNLYDISDNVLKEKPGVFNDALRQLSLSGWAPHGLCIKKELLEKVGGYREHMLWLEITELHVRCALVQPRILIFPKPLFRVIGIPDSVSRIVSHRIEGMRQMGEILFDLSKEYPSYAEILEKKSKSQLMSYASSILLSGMQTEARKFLINKYPYEHDHKWWKMWFGSWIPKYILQNYMNKARA